ncbi:hypothetical protein [Streptomyces olivaceoviridis]|uniref:hypothetical protein n=1 Tax=Streptomyces olivaceoviridis TaxID=1921 RepID=UPI00370348B2
MARYEVYGTVKASPADGDWETLLATDDAVEATQVMHESEGTFWRRLLEDGQVVLPCV